MLNIITIENDSEGILGKETALVKIEEMKGLKPLIGDMIDKVDALRAVGLAAPQVGVSKRLFVLVLHDGSHVVCINPKTVAKTGRIMSRGEGCLSIPGKFYNIRRWRRVVLQYIDENGDSCIFKPEKKITNIAIQHEMDHLQGILLSAKR